MAGLNLFFWRSWSLLLILAEELMIGRSRLKDIEIRGSKTIIEESEALWNYYTDLTPKKEEVSIKASTRAKEFYLEASKNASAMLSKHVDLSHDVARQMRLIRRNAMPNLQKDVEAIEKLQANLTAIFSNGRVCKNSTDSSNFCMPLFPDLNNLMAKSRDYDELVWAWRGWRDAVGPPMRAQYKELVDMLNRGASEHNWGDYGHFVRSEYEMGNDLIPVLNGLWTAVKPLYQELHAYVRYQLKKHYKKMSPDGPIGAHLLGNMWAQDWSAIYDLVQPFPDVAPLHVTPNLIKQHYTPKKMFELAQSFFVSIGLDAMPASFWDKSVLSKPENKSMVCHASAWDFCQGDVRIKMCTSVNQDDLITVHHEMGHVEYYLAYKDLPYAYRTGANPGFHEAIGDTITLSVETPKHLKSIGLLYSLNTSDEATINFLMLQALRRVASLPFTYLVDKWRWKVFAGNIRPSEYNAEWWKLRTYYQGIVAPVPRSENDFDPGAKFHIGSNSQYICYFVSLILQFQFHQSLCRLAKHEGPLHECSIYKSKEAGQKFREMLEAGSSQPWPQTLHHLTGEREMSANAILEYFDPLKKWLFTYRQAHKYPLGWGKLKKQGTANGVRKTINNSSLKPKADSLAANPKGVSFTKAKNSNDGLNLPDLKTALEELQPGNSKTTVNKNESLLEAKSSIVKARPMFLPNKVKDQLNLG
ncbi:angiotensin-converting enzyme-like [Actinia tenebrosa]|uniref:Angiotensin-converting enzyme n=1 Tax=Actinia tenebrosa TaxID=6105 RepID=A0A6P8HRE3_ACTTE|nr:angiotensin-converting enzyme-like [Actinia tenebrosa]